MAKSHCQLGRCTCLGSLVDATTFRIYPMSKNLGQGKYIFDTIHGHFDNAYKDFTCNDFTYNIVTLHVCLIYCYE
jgi:hypothetical protein